MNNKKLTLSLFTVLVFFTFSSNSFQTATGVTVKAGSNEEYRLEGFQITRMDGPIPTITQELANFKIFNVYNTNTDLTCTTDGSCTYTGTVNRLANISVNNMNYSNVRDCYAKVEYIVDNISYYIIPALRNVSDSGYEASFKSQFVQLTPGSVIKFIAFEPVTILTVITPTCDGNVTTSALTSDSTYNATHYLIQLL